MQSMSLYKNCLLCPRRCGVDREAGERGYCGETSELRLGFAGIHRGEEPPITGNGGSGTIFVSGCNLGCAFCQNFQISREGIGRAVSPEEFAEICLTLQQRGAENINIVTGSHAAPALALGTEEARKRGLSVPVLWNSSGYEGAETLEIIKDFVDVYLPDLKTMDSLIAAKFFNAPDYPEHAARAILKMMEYRETGCGPQEQTMVSGVMVRHLVIPGCMEATRQVLAWFSENCAGYGRGSSRGHYRDHSRGSGQGNRRNRALLSLMTQYTPVKASGPAIPDRFVSKDEYDAVLSMLDEFGIEDGFCQELVTGSDWLPDFRQPNPFSSELSVPVWHWRKLFRN